LTLIIKKIKNALFFIFVFILVALGSLVAPIIRGGYRYAKFVDCVYIGMERDLVHKTANDIGYHNFNREIIGKGIIKKDCDDTEYDKSVDIYYFKNFMLDNVVVIYYDKLWNVKKIETD